MTHHQPWSRVLIRFIAKNLTAPILGLALIERGSVQQMENEEAMKSAALA